MREEPEELSDRELVVRASYPLTRRAALHAIYERYHLRILRFCADRLRYQDGAVDAAADTFAELIRYFAEDKTLRDPDALAGFLYRIADRRTMRYMRGGSPGKGHRPALDMLGVNDVSQMDLDESFGLTPAESFEMSRAEDAAGLDRVRHLLDTQVVTTFTAAQQRMYEASVRRGLYGKALADHLDMTPDQAKNTAERIRKLAENGFAALVLFRDARRVCRDLDRIILGAVARDGDTFTAQVREQIVRHFDTCSTCQKCEVCNPLRRRLIAPYSPALVPVVYATELRERVMRQLDQLSRSVQHHDTPPRPPDEPEPPSRPKRPKRPKRRRSRRPRRLHELFRARPAKAAGGHLRRSALSKPYVIALGIAPVILVALGITASLLGLNPLSAVASAPLKRPDPCALISRADAEREIGASSSACYSWESPKAVSDASGLGPAAGGYFSDPNDTPEHPPDWYLYLSTYDAGGKATTAFDTLEQRTRSALPQLSNDFNVKMGRVPGLGDDNFYVCGLWNVPAPTERTKKYSNIDCSKAASLSVRRSNIVLVIEILRFEGTGNALEQVKHLTERALRF
ncbi:RNA polymerase sigma factor [Sphaerisporangium corydalis]|uniref:RNA polymerase sigma factor n=1 Tax=Sphaerisporangium corydalis TaxID=1441875 RepID=A0ABV9EK28_9ACTN|nr:hypothetical protein [Sphaerisporangium corydalis]